MNLSLAWVLPLVLVAGVKAMGERQPRTFEAGAAHRPELREDQQRVGFFRPYPPKLASP